MAYTPELPNNLPTMRSLVGSDSEKANFKDSVFYVGADRLKGTESITYKTKDDLLKKVAPLAEGASIDGFCRATGEFFRFNEKSFEPWVINVLDQLFLPENGSAAQPKPTPKSQSLVPFPSMHFDLARKISDFLENQVLAGTSYDEVSGALLVPAINVSQDINYSIAQVSDGYDLVTVWPVSEGMLVLKTMARLTGEGSKFTIDTQVIDGAVLASLPTLSTEAQAGTDEEVESPDEPEVESPDEVEDKSPDEPEVESPDEVKEETEVAPEVADESDNEPGIEPELEPEIEEFPEDEDQSDIAVDAEDEDQSEGILEDEDSPQVADEADEADDEDNFDFEDDSFEIEL